MADVTIVFNQLYSGQEVKNVTVWSNGPETEEDIQSAANALRGSWAVNAAPILSNQWSLYSCTFVFNESAPIFSVEVPFSLGIVTGLVSASDRSVSQLALLVSTRYFGVPPNRGRIYFAGLTEDATANGLWVTTAVEDLQDMVQGWADGVDYSTNTMFLRIARRNADGTLDVTSPVSNVIGRTNPATQRRRRIGVGS